MAHCQKSGTRHSGRETLKIHNQNAILPAFGRERRRVVDFQPSYCDFKQAPPTEATCTHRAYKQKPIQKSRSPRGASRVRTLTIPCRIVGSWIR